MISLIIPCLCALPVQNVYAKAKSLPADEYERGIWYGFMPKDISKLSRKKAAKMTITYKQFCEMLGKMVKKTDLDKYAAWKKLSKKADKTPMKRDAGAIALVFAAKTLGFDYLNANNGHIDAWCEYDWKSDYSGDYKVFPWKKKVTAYNNPGLKDFGLNFDDYIDWSFVFCARRVSSITGKTLMTCDKNSDFHMNENLTVEDALTATTRLYESEEKTALETAEKILDEVKKTPKAKKLINASEAQKQKIINSRTEIVRSDTYEIGKTYTGTAYYVSNNGNDENDGLSPESPWQTLGRLQNVEFKFGDAIFFKRGGVWRNAQLPHNVRTTEGLTVSAYGSGEKPKFYGSTENGSGLDKWTLYYQKGSKKIWKYHIQLADVWVIVLNDGESYCKRAVPYWNGEKYVLMHDHNKAFSVKKDLSDMECFPNLKYLENPESIDLIYQLGWDNDLGATTLLKGDLYLRCDAGNPGELYKSIEFTEPYCGASGLANHTVIDNIEFSYELSPVPGGIDMPEYVYFQNCISGWGGGEVNYYSENPGEAGEHMFSPCLGYVFMDGGSGFNAHGSHNVVRNNYVHHGFQDGFGAEIFNFNTKDCGDITIEGNVVEYCVFAGGYRNWDPESSYPAKNVSIKNNFILYTGFENFYNIEPPVEYSYVHDDAQYSSFPGYLTNDASSFAVTGEGQNAHDGTLEVSGNVFAFSYGQLVKIETYTELFSRVYKDNTYAQLPGFSWFATNHGNSGANLEKFTDPEEAVREWIYDKTGKIVRFD